MASAPERYHIFSGRHPSSDVCWIESVQGLDAAKQRTNELARLKPGPYFVFSASSESPVYQVDTTPKI